MSLLSRLENLERSTRGIAYLDHFITYTVAYGDDEPTKREAALAEFRATHKTSPSDEFGFIVLRIVEAVDGRPKHPEWAGQP
jgi:hypothetical protein